jgi:hypothetical protein
MSHISRVLRPVADCAYQTIALDDDARRANDKLDRFLEADYGQPAAALRKRQMGYAGPASGLAELGHRNCRRLNPNGLQGRQGYSKPNRNQARRSFLNA